MSLSSAIKTMLNRFADTQPALRLPNKPYSTSNPNLGDALDTAITAATTSAQAYTPAVTGNWTGADPTTVAQALDRIAAALGPIA